MASLGGFMHAPMNRLRFSCLVFLKVDTSCLNASRVASSSRYSMLSILMATAPCQFPWYTVLNLPEPILSPMMSSS